MTHYELQNITMFWLVLNACKHCNEQFNSSIVKMALIGHLDFDMTLNWTWIFNIRNEWCIHENPRKHMKDVLYIILR